MLITDAFLLFILLDFTCSLNCTFFHDFRRPNVGWGSFNIATKIQLSHYVSQTYRALWPIDKYYRILLWRDSWTLNNRKRKFNIRNVNKLGSNQLLNLMYQCLNRAILISRKSSICICYLPWAWLKFSIIIKEVMYFKCFYFIV